MVYRIFCDFAYMGRSCLGTLFLIDVFQCSIYSSGIQKRAVSMSSRTNELALRVSFVQWKVWKENGGAVARSPLNRKQGSFVIAQHCTLLTKAMSYGMKLDCSTSVRLRAFLGIADGTAFGYVGYAASDGSETYGTLLSLNSPCD